MRFTINDAQDIREEAVRDILEERGHTLVKSGEGAEVCLHFSRTDAPGYRAVKDGGLLPVWQAAAQGSGLTGYNWFVRENQKCFTKKGMVGDFEKVALTVGELALPDEAEIISGKGVRVPDGRIAAPDDLIPVDSAFGCSGPAVFYLVSEFETPIDMEILISVGHSGPMVFCLDGRELVRTRQETWRTPENLNLDELKLPAGRHRAVFKVVRQGEKVTLSINYKNSFRPGEQGNAHCTNFTFLV